MNKNEEYKAECADRIRNYPENKALIGSAKEFMVQTIINKYSYNFIWLGRPIIQYPQDMIAMQEIIWQVKPDLIIETGIAHGGSLIFYASLLELIGNNGKVLGIDIDIREHNKEEVEKHPLFKRIILIEGSSIDPKVIEKVKKQASKARKAVVVLDSNHTHEHVLKEMQLYSTFVKIGSYLVVFDTIIEDLPEKLFSDRPWGKGNNPRTAVNEFMKTNHDFEVDKNIEDKILISVAPNGYLKRIR